MKGPLSLASRTPMGPLIQKTASGLERKWDVELLEGRMQRRLHEFDDSNPESLDRGSTHQRRRWTGVLIAGLMSVGP